MPLECPPPPNRKYVLLGFTVLAGLLGCAAFPPVGFGALGWLALIPLIIVLGQVDPREGFWHGWLFGTIFMGGNMAYVSKYGLAPWLVLAAIMGMFFGVFGVLAATLRHASPLRRVPALAATWYLLELLRGHCGSFSLTFGDLGYSQTAQLGLIQIASAVGHYGVGFLMALLGAGVGTTFVALLPQTWWRPGDPRLFNRDAGRMAVLCFFLVFVVFFGGEAVVRSGSEALKKQADQTGVKVAAVQAEGAYLGRGVRMTSQQALDLYLAQSRLATGADLIVWPETAVLTPLSLDPSSAGKISQLALDQKSNLLIGVNESDQGRTCNSAFFYTPDGQHTGTYRKMDLVMFGEYVPLRDKISFFKRYPIRNFDYCRGDGRMIFHTARYSFSPLICFEGIFPDQTRQVARLGADVIVLITSDAWAANSFELVQHSDAELFRSIESRKYVIRAATNGLSAIYDPYGTIIAQVPFYQNGIATANILPQQGLSLYDQLGDAPLLLLSLALLLVGLLEARLVRR